LTETFPFRTTSAEDTRRFGRALGALLEAGDFVGLTGTLGSGKTVVIQGAALGLGYEGYVTSPTFVIVNEYEGRVPVLHVDLYRITDCRELDDIGYREIFFGDGVSLVEWADRATEMLPSDGLRIEIEVVGQEERAFVVTALGERGRRLLDDLSAVWPGEAGP
jgi:tRNA threonylcarbamoyladenosine biosynthesis protein TsaE